MATPRAYLDSNAIIRFIESADDDLVFLFERASNGHAALFTSTFTLAEVLVKPMQDNDTDLVSAYRHFLAAGDVLTMSDLDRETLILTAEIRATVGNKTPDAIHIATALAENCGLFVSSDKRLKMPDGLTRIAIPDIRAALP